jgi:hypothetical protein
VCGSPLLRNAATREGRAAQGSKNTETKKVKKRESYEIACFFALFGVFGAVRRSSALFAPSMLKWSKAKATHNLVAAEGLECYSSITYNLGATLQRGKAATRQRCDSRVTLRPFRPVVAFLMARQRN